MLAVRRQVSIVSGDGCVLFEHFGRGRKKAGKKRDDVVEGTVVAAEGQVRPNRYAPPRLWQQSRVSQSLQPLLCLSRSFSSCGCAGWLLAVVSGAGGLELSGPPGVHAHAASLRQRRGSHGGALRPERRAGAGARVRAAIMSCDVHAA